MNLNYQQANKRCYDKENCQRTKLQDTDKQRFPYCFDTRILVYMPQGKKEIYRANDEWNLQCERRPRKSVHYKRCREKKEYKAMEMDRKDEGANVVKSFLPK